MIMELRLSSNSDIKKLIQQQAVMLQQQGNNYAKHSLFAMNIGPLVSIK